MRVVFLLCFCSTLMGCTSMALRRSTVAGASTLTDLEYEMVLDNIAMVRSHPGALPWGVKLAQGSVTIRDNLESLFAITWPFTRRTAEVFGSRYWTESWTTVPVVDADQLNGLQAIYANSAYAPWIQAGVPTEAGAPTGHYGLEIVWVRSKDIGELTKLTLQVLRAAPIKPGERAFLVPGPPPSF